MSEFNINLSAGEKKRLLTGGKYCTDDIVVEAEGGDTNAAFEAGRKAEYDAFWENACPNPDNVYGIGAFAGRAWNDYTFRPPKTLTITGNCNFCFYYCDVTDITDKVKFQNINMAQSMFTYGSIKKIGRIDFSQVSSLAWTFNASKAVSVEEMVVGASTAYNATFAAATELTDLTVSGTIGQNGFDVKDCKKLTKSSITSIINALSSTTSGLSVTISKTAKEAAFTAEEWSALVATKQNWTISLA